MQKFVPTDLPGQIATMTAALCQMRDDLAALATRLTSDQATDAPSTGHWMPINQYVANSGLALDSRIVGLWVSADTTDEYYLQVGNDKASYLFFLAAFQPVLFNFTGLLDIPVTRGLPLSVGQVTAGTAKVRANLCYVPIEDIGAKS